MKCVVHAHYSRQKYTIKMNWLEFLIGIDAFISINNSKTTIHESITFHLHSNL